METIKATLEFGDEVKSYNEDAMYLVDFTKIESVNDLVLIFAAMGITFHGKHPHFQAIKKFVDLDKPINPNQFQKPEQKEIRLPKLKTL